MNENLLLPDKILNGIFQQIQLVYGSRFLDSYRGIPLQNVKRHWASILARVTPAQVRVALENLPADYPPNALQFLQLCGSSNTDETRKLFAQMDADKIAAVPCPPHISARIAALKREMRAASAL